MKRHKSKIAYKIADASKLHVENCRRINTVFRMQYSILNILCVPKNTKYFMLHRY